MKCLYNENDPKTAAWLRELVRAGLVEEGVVDERSIEELRPEDCPERAHFFAGIGGWPYALELAGWGADEPVWTGSCPCQPFSAAGRGEGADDARHLWPVWFGLIAECRPATIFGEQVASRDGRAWLAGVRADLETLGYSVGAADLCAASVGAPHIRQRLFWVAVRMGDSRGERRQQERRGAPSDEEADGRRSQGDHEPSGAGAARGLGDTDQQGSQGRRLRPREEPDQLNPWARGFDIVHCTDGKARRFEPGSFPLAVGIQARVVRLRGYGNAINPHVGAAFVRAFMEIQEESHG